MTQSQALYKLLSDGLPHRTDEIMEVVYGGSHLGLARVGARIWDLKQKGYEISGWHDKDNQSLYWYQLKSWSGKGVQISFHDNHFTAA